MPINPTVEYIQDTILPNVFFCMAVLQLFSTDVFGIRHIVPGYSFLFVAITAIYSSPVTQFPLMIIKPIQFISAVRVFRRYRARKQLNIVIKLVVLAVGLQSFPVLILCQALDMIFALWRGDFEGDHDWVAAYWKDDVVLILMVVALAMEFGCERGMPVVSRWVDEKMNSLEDVVDEDDGQEDADDRMEKGEGEKYVEENEDEDEDEDEVENRIEQSDGKVCMVRNYDNKEKGDNMEKGEIGTVANKIDDAIPN